MSAGQNIPPLPSGAALGGVMAAPPPPPPQEGVLNTEALHLNDEIVDMCMLLDYENRFCTKELKPMPRTFFAYPAPNPAHQFKYFSQLVAFGLAFLNIKADWDEFDDPTTVMTSMQEVQEQIREKQRQAQAKKKAKKSSHGPEAPAQPIEASGLRRRWSSTSSV
eukprot:g18762.t1